MSVAIVEAIARTTEPMKKETVMRKTGLAITAGAFLVAFAGGPAALAQGGDHRDTVVS